MSTRTVDNGQDIIDSRDIIARIEELEGQDERDEDETAELAALKNLAEQAEGYGAWNYGETLIRDTYFKQYAQELADDIGAIPSGLSWPCTCIDWDRAVRELKHDYMSVDFDGVEYWMRA